jgi:hypothetical protein
VQITAAMLYDLVQCAHRPAMDLFGETSVLALGISRDTAARLGKEFRQNAIVWIGTDRIPDLIFLQ